ncbi:RDD family protein [Colwellia sp. M166]|mgnify:FL=1|uniref:RDD family protein n=1 Tax=Colwellia sp. M166 TaxID=2583805 RepID=UPI00211E9C7C|nr:RDD family protein [Colwellia sp. M166]
MTDNVNAGFKKISATASNENCSTAAESSAQVLSAEETRETLTPFAFKIDQSLFGIALAVPWRRGAALLIDLCLVAILSGAPGELLAVLVAITLFKLGSKQRAAKFGKKPGLRKTLLRLTGAFIVFVVLIDTLPNIFSQMNDFNNQVERAGQQPDTVLSPSNKIKNNRDEQGFIKGTLSVAATVAIAQSECDEYACWQQLTADLLLAYVGQSPTAQQAEQFIALLIANVTEQDSLSRLHLEQLSTELRQLYITTGAQQKNQTTTDASDLVREINDNSTINQNTVDKIAELSTLDTDIEHEKSKGNSSNEVVYKGFAWLQGLIEDLGIGFGWAAFYFTMFTAIWHGQTPGKKLFHIRVIQLDGTPLSIWDSFGRYGGYGAGIATGLLGFAQIYWDPNRQAIHDKISATIVVNDNDTR